MSAEPLSVASVAPLSVPRRPSWLPALAAGVCIAMTIWLGLWQLGRADEKRDRQAAYDAAAALQVLSLSELSGPVQPGRRVRVGGHFDGAHQIYLDNRVLHGRPGYHLIVPLTYPGGAVLVNRGWLPAGQDRSRPPLAPTPAGKLSLDGILVPAQGRYLELAAPQVGPVWQNLDLARYRVLSGHNLPDWLLLQTSASDDGLLREWPRPDAGVERHLGYAVQWFSLSAAIVALYGYYGWWRPHHAH